MIGLPSLGLGPWVTKSSSVEKKTLYSGTWHWAVAKPININMIDTSSNSRLILNFRIFFSFSIFFKIPSLTYLSFYPLHHLLPTCNCLTLRLTCRTAYTKTDTMLIHLIFCRTLIKARRFSLAEPFIRSFKNTVNLATYNLFCNVSIFLYTSIFPKK